MILQMNFEDKYRYQEHVYQYYAQNPQMYRYNEHKYRYILMSIDTGSLSIDTELGSSLSWHETLKCIDTSVYVSIPVDEYRYSPKEHRYRAWQ